MSATRPGPGPSASTPETASWHDEAFTLLSNRRRRFALHYLQQHDDTVDLGDLAEQVAAWENDTTVPEVSAAERKRVYTSLQQVHLPRMDESDVIAFDDRAGAVRLGPTAEDLDLYVELVEGRDVSWSQYYLLLGGLNAVVLAGAVAGVPVLSVLPGVAFAVFTLTTFLASALVHTYYGHTEMRLGTEARPPEVDR
jgi:hypothetical protein